MDQYISIFEKFKLKSQCVTDVCLPGRVAQSVMCLTRDVRLTADLGVVGLIVARSHTFVEIDHEIIWEVILLSSIDSFKKGVVVSYKRKNVLELLVSPLFKLAQEKSVVS